MRSFLVKRVFLKFAILILVLTFFAFFTNKSWTNPGSKELELVLHLNQYSRYSSLWGWSDGDKYYVCIGTKTGTSIVDVSDLENITGETTFISGPSSSWREMKSYKDYLYVVTEGYPGGLQIIDMKNFDKPTLVKVFFPSEAQSLTAHTIFIDQAKERAYLNGAYSSGDYGMIILDLTDPLDPEQLGFFSDSYVHDCFVKNNICYAAEIYNGRVEVLDVSDPANINILTSFSTPQRFTHSAWLDNGRLFVEDEVSDNGLLIYDVSDSNHIKLLNFFKNPLVHKQSVLHTVVTNNNLVYCAWYTEGIRVLNMENINNIYEVGYYNTYPNPSMGGQFGCWQVYVDNRGYIYGSDIENGLYIVK